ncbi:transposase, mutator-like family protein [Leptospira borgpetersenii serovar Mini str. 201000851]|uniref:Mutator family transposase n=3 Tax=Leptospira borgpetersenii TaxID=174 RepID=M3HWS6_LEPBO|nr:transposase, mutator-like family protein [Leptospira borgpetersenii str. 200801926]EMG02035.1 transposase, mutator-like family protein [Leptospira borgpetersenii str. 200701203]EMN14664.1 transposase, mutator-like family protein [Leptospira borgpetersenii str. Brem 307]EMN15584.1 transposase, mutator-like family protein [Leptospira borgpetersenii str. Brem 328]ENO65742.1 transposase, mutator-like family protein [Leptospira borgpetersenii serovar Mini str. 201000851]
MEVSADLISQVTDSVMETVIEWQNRSLDKVYPILIMDALIVKVRNGNHVVNKAFYLALELVPKPRMLELLRECSNDTIH